MEKSRRLRFRLPVPQQQYNIGLSARRLVTDIRTSWYILCSLGPRWALYRIWYAIRKRLGILERQFPISTWEIVHFQHLLKHSNLADPDAYLSYRREKAPPFFFDPRNIRAFIEHFRAWDKDGFEAPVPLAEQIHLGRFRYFHNEIVKAGFPPAWHVNPFTQDPVPAYLHWSRIGDFDHGDIKVIWELSRFSFAYTLVRAYWRTCNDHYAECFWRLVEDWMEQNPPQQGPNWMCGQEISFRVMACCFGLYGLLNSRATTPSRIAALARMIALSCRRIAGNTGYALSQQNNHAISEAMGLWTVGTLFPEFLHAEQWEKTGREILENLGKELIYDDGSFAQHSLNYQRLVVDVYLWCLRLADLHERPFSMALRQRLGKAATFLYGAQDKTSGMVPRYGQDDGTLILPLNNCGYLDFRPAVQAALYLVTGTRPFPAGPWDEDLLWLFGPAALDAPVAPSGREGLRAEAGGYYAMRSANGLLFTRCPRFRHRPGQADMLHVDIWWKGRNMAIDPGTYSYNGEAPWGNAFSSAHFHNTVTVDDQDQMEQVSRFLWLPWAAGRVLRHRESPGRHLTYWEGEHSGYGRLRLPVRHCRGILKLGADSWLVLDALRSKASHRYRLHWLFPDLPYEWDEKKGALRLDAPEGTYRVHMTTTLGNARYSLVRASAKTARGWRSPFYSSIEPALSADMMVEADSVVFWTLLGPEDFVMTNNHRTLSIGGEFWNALIKITDNAATAGAPLVRHVSINGFCEDALEILA